MPDSSFPVGRIHVGTIGRAHGVQGLVKITSHTADPADLTAYGSLSDAAGHLYALRWKAKGVAEVSRVVDGVPVKLADRSAAEKLTNTKLFIDRSALPPPADEEEYYLTDLIGMGAVDSAGNAIGTVSMVHDYGGGASLEIVRSVGPLIVPFTAACVPTVDVNRGWLVVLPPDEIVIAPNAEGIVQLDANGAVQSRAGATSRRRAEDAAT